MNKEQEIMLKRLKRKVDKDTTKFNTKWYLLRLDEHTKVLSDKVVSFFLPSEVTDFDDITKKVDETKCPNIFDDLRMASKCIAIDETKETYLFDKQFGKYKCLTFVDVADEYGFLKEYFKLVPKRNVWYGYYNIDKKVPVFTFRHKDGSVLATILPVVAKWLE